MCVTWGFSFRQVQSDAVCRHPNPHKSFVFFVFPTVLLRDLCLQRGFVRSSLFPSLHTSSVATCKGISLLLLGDLVVELCLTCTHFVSLLVPLAKFFRTQCQRGIWSVDWFRWSCGSRGGGGGSSGERVEVGKEESGSGRCNEVVGGCRSKEIW